MFRQHVRDKSTWLMQSCECPAAAVDRGAGEEVFNTSLISTNRKETQGGSVAGAGLPGELLAVLGKARGSLSPCPAAFGWSRAPVAHGDRLRGRWELGPLGLC